MRLRRKLAILATLIFLIEGIVALNIGVFFALGGQTLLTGTSASSVHLYTLPFTASPASNSSTSSSSTTTGQQAALPQGTSF